MNELPRAAAPFKTIGLAHQYLLCICALEHDIDFLNCTNNSHVAVYRDVLFENVYVVRFEAAKYTVEHLQHRLNAS